MVYVKLGLDYEILNLESLKKKRDLCVSSGMNEYLCFLGWKNECLRMCRVCSMGDLSSLATTFFSYFLLSSLFCSIFG